jgi:hypothetical protein
VNHRRFAAIAIVLVAVLCAGCTQAVWIMSQPSIAKVYINGELQGETPLRIWPTHHLFASLDIKLVKEGYHDYRETVGVSTMTAINVIASLPLITMFWTWQFEDEYAFALIPLATGPEVVIPGEPAVPNAPADSTPAPGVTPDPSATEITPDAPSEAATPDSSPADAPAPDASASPVG